jgi:TetR/AcrR family transcriptional regulator, transcriptional repressor for nem operon
VNPPAAATNVRQHILDVAKPLLLNRGFTAVGLAEVLTAARVPKGSFYHYFSSKEAFGEAVLEEYFAGYFERMDTLLARPGKAAQRLMGYFDNWLASQTGDEAQSRCLAVKLGAEVCDLSDSMRAALERGTRGVIERLARCIEEGRADRSLSPPLTIEGLLPTTAGPTVPRLSTAPGQPLAPATQGPDSRSSPPHTRDSQALATVLYQTWLGAGLLAKFARDRAPLDIAMASTRALLGLSSNT